MSHQFRENGTHYNGGSEFFGYGYEAMGEPRLTMTRFWYRQGKRRGTTRDAFYVDGVKAQSYDAAIAALKTPPTFTPEEADALAQIGDEPADWRKIIGFECLHSLAAKGAIEWGPPGRCKRTDAGRAVLTTPRTLPCPRLTPPN